ncbi:MAG: DUF4214 domain-containing protein [Clostridia bacterium]|nr:DUF4214 domain-containing protein [Clostridia bacterium]
MKKKSIISIIAATLAAVSLFWMIPAGKVSAVDKKISDIFADKNLQAWVKENVDSNKDGKLSQTEINAVTDIVVSNMDISDMTGISVFTNLTKLNCAHNDLTELDLTGLTALTEIDCSYNQLTVFNAKSSKDLEVLNCRSNKLKNGMAYFNVSGSILLKRVDISSNEFTSLDWGNKRTKLEYFDCSYNKLKTLNISGVTALTELNCSHNLLDSIDISGLNDLALLNCYDVKNVDISSSNVTQLTCGGSRLESLILSEKLETLTMTDSVKIKELDLRDCKELTSVSCRKNDLEILNVSGLEKLRTLQCSYNELTDLTTGNNKELNTVDCQHNNLKNLKIDANLYKLNCQDNPLEYLDISEASELREVGLMGYSGNNGQYVIYSGKVSGNYHEYRVDKGVKIITEAKSGEPANNNRGQEPSGESGDLIRGFVERLYTSVLGRDAETDGLNFWTSDLYNFKVTGAQVAQGFIFSQEFKDRNTSNEDFVRILYKTFFDREPETDGFNYWVGLLKSGTSRETVANGFIFSQEWADTCATYGIRSGCDIKALVNIKPTDLTYAFVERLYVKAFNRDFDAEGREYWANLLSNYSITGEQAGASFFLSKEMTDYNLSDEEFVNRLYSTFMDREGEKDGVDYWVGLLKGGASRESVVYGFTRSPEFTEKCIVARILPY